MIQKIEQPIKSRVRYAPSPTGEPHVGNIRTAIFDWLLVKNNGGEFVVRVEDTDQNRRVEGAIEKQRESLEWLGLCWDEGFDKEGPYGPYTQSERLDYYAHAVDLLIANGFAYKCYCSPQRLSELREEQRARKLSKVGYDGKCRNITEMEAQHYFDSGATSVVRFSMPDAGVSRIIDMVRGTVEFENDLVDDFVILKADGFPTYHLASVVDDHHMEITHVLRGEEWLSSVPRHIQLYDALGWEPPLFAHLPAILAPDKSKLSKRHGATSILEYKEKGYLPDAMLNFLSLLGWSLDGETEILSRDEIAKNFDLTRVNIAGAVFDREKLDWMNGYYIRQMTDEGLADYLCNYWNEFPPTKFDRLPNASEATPVASLVKDRLKTLSDAEHFVAFLFRDHINYDSEKLIQKGMDTEKARIVLEIGRKKLSDLESFYADEIEIALRSISSEMEAKTGQVLGTLRMATSGQDVSPPLFPSLEILGKEKVLLLLDKAIMKLDA